jgi:hypothetical protein
LIRTSAFLTTVFCNPFQRFGANAVQFIADIVNRNENAVVTWGFAPDDQTSVAAVLLFRSNGFKLVWLDGDRRAALERFEERTRTRASSDAEFYWRMHEFYVQMYRIENTRIIETILPVIINPLNNRQEFKTQRTCSRKSAMPE